MEYLIGVSSQTAAIFAVAVILIAVFATALKNIQLAELFESTGTGKISHTKFWANVAYFVSTIAFVDINFKPSPPEYLVELWFVYLATVAGNASISKFLSLKYSNQNADTERSSTSANMIDKG